MASSSTCSSKQQDLCLVPKGMSSNENELCTDTVVRQVVTLNWKNNPTGELLQCRVHLGDFNVPLLLRN